MQNKGTIVAFTVIITLLCLYYLSFTFVSQGVQNDARNYATDSTNVVDLGKKQKYLDSVWNVPVYNFFDAEYTYKEVKDLELSLGLDLQGGMHVTLEISPSEIIRNLAGNNANEAFNNAIKEAQKKQLNSQSEFSDLFFESYKELSDKPLSTIFATAENRERINRNDDDQQVIEVIKKEIDDAIDRSFIILRTRLDQFGTSQPNIQRLKGTGRIQIEIPGAENPERVRKLLQGVAKLEFWEVAELSTLNNSLMGINNLLVEEQKLALKNDQLGDTLDNNSISNDLKQKLSLQEDNLETSDDIDSTIEQLDSLQEKVDSLNSEVSPLFALNKARDALIYNINDTATISAIIRRDDVKNLLPSNVKMLWEVKPTVNTETHEELLQLFFIKIGRRGKPQLTGEVITDARQDLDEYARPAVSMQMNSNGTRIWRKMTAEAASKTPKGRIAIVLDNLVYSAPYVNGEIPNGNSSISGNFTIEEAKDLANILKAGSLPAPTRIVEEAIIGPTLGKIAQQQGMISILSGLIIVALFMIVYYAKGGLIANVALIFNIFFILGILAQFNAALTLPGIAGIVLTIGMSIDANVLIFERIREELRKGVQLRESISIGYKKAFSSIVDANVTTGLTALFLFVLGQGPIKGFAITLMIGIVSSFFSAVFITRVLVEWIVGKSDKSKVSFKTPISKNMLSNLNFNFMKKRRIAYVFSTIFIAFGLSIMFYQGLNIGVDFQGGRSYTVMFKNPVVATDMKIALSDSFEKSGTEVKNFGGNNIIKVTTSYLVNDESDQADEQVREALIQGITNFTNLTYTENEKQVDDTHFTISGSSKVGATIADDIQNASFKSGFFAIIAIFLYILIRFRKWQFSTGAIIALVHDTAFVFSAFSIISLFGVKYEVDQVFVAAILTIIGYSINDTVVVFDRIREFLNLATNDDKIQIFNNAINGTLNRTLITSLTTLIVIVILFIFGGEVLRGFSFALLVGVLVGTYSSVFVASPVVIDLEKKGR